MWVGPGPLKSIVQFWAHSLVLRTLSGPQEPPSSPQKLPGAPRITILEPYPINPFLTVSTLNTGYRCMLHIVPWNQSSSGHILQFWGSLQDPKSVLLSCRKPSGTPRLNSLEPCFMNSIPVGPSQDTACICTQSSEALGLLFHVKVPQRTPRAP